VALPENDLGEACPPKPLGEDGPMPPKLTLSQPARLKLRRMILRALTILVAVLTVCATPAMAGGGGGHGDGKAKAKTPAKRQVTTLVSWVDVDPFTVSVIQRQGVTGTFMVSFGIDVPDEALRTRAEAILPRLRNNWLLAINQFASTNLRPRTQADIDGLSAKLQRVADETLGKPGAKVLMSNAVVLIK
jgi:flagellar basal body-associated protein FliL